MKNIEEHLELMMEIKDLILNKIKKIDKNRINEI
jgi:hypothetical protein